jgi:transposase InsO family protein
VRQVALAYPWWGYKRLAVICRRQGLGVTNRFVYRVLQEAGLLQRRRPRSAELYQTARLFELLPQGPNELWQADVTYVHIPGFGWWYAVTVIDYFSRYLLALHLSSSNDAAALTVAVDRAIAEAERWHGPLDRVPVLVTDNGSNFLARRFREHIEGRLCQVRTQYRTPQQLGLLERFHLTLKLEEIYWDLYRSPAMARDRLGAFRLRYNEVRPHWALRPIGGGDPVTPADVYCRGVKVEIPAWQQWARQAKAKLDELLREDAEAA